MATHAEKITAAAVLYVERFGFSVIPMSRDKKPTVKWKDYQTRRPTIGEILDWPKENLAIVTGSISRLVVVDCESEEDARWFWKERGKSPTVVKTRRGYHLYFQHPGEPVANGQKIEDRYDVRGDGGYVLAPPSRHAEGAYTFTQSLLAQDKLPVFNPAWRPPPASYDETRKVTHGVSYIQKIRAVAGQRGHDTTYRAARTLRDSGLSEGEALLAMQQWNQTNAEPPWSDAELLHKVRSAYT